MNFNRKSPALNKLEKWAAHGVITLQFTEPAQNEAAASRSARRTKKAWSYVAALPLPKKDEEQERLRKIERIIFGDRRLSPQDKNDALNVFTARKYFAILVTADGEVIKAANRLRDELHFEVVMTAESAVENVRIRIRQRDKMKRAEAGLEGCPLPDWVGKD